MKAYQLIQKLNPALVQEIVSYVQKDTREAFRTALLQIGNAKKLRPQYFHNKSREQQAEWLLEHLKQKTHNGISEQILQLWLLKAKTPMLTTFLDATGIKHDGNGQVEDLPEELSDEQVEAGITAMLKENPPEHVALYLYLFQQQKEEGWPAITKALEKHKDLQLFAE